MNSANNNTPQADEIIDSFFEIIDDKLLQVDELLNEYQLNIDLTAARKTVQTAGESVSRSLQKLLHSPDSLADRVKEFLFAVVHGILSLISASKKQTTPGQPHVADEDLPFVEDEPTAEEVRRKTAQDSLFDPDKDIRIPFSGDETVDSVVAYQLKQISFVEDCAVTIYSSHPDTAKQLVQICREHRCILYALARRPETLPKLQKFFGYYVPTLKKFTSAFVDVSRQVQSANVENAEKTMQQLKEAFVSLEQAFHKKTDELYGVVELDISSDISVLDAMLRKDGLI